MKKLYEDQQVRVTGDVMYCGEEVEEWFDVDTYGIIEKPGENESLITLEYIDGDINACVYVNNDIIYEL